MMASHVYELHVYEVITELDADGATPTLIDCAPLLHRSADCPRRGAAMVQRA